MDRTRRTSSSSPARTSASTVAPATPTTSSRGRGRPASPATWRTTTPPRRRCTARPATHRLRRAATPRPPGLGATFNHVLTWPDYTGAHPAVACATCHADNVYKGKSDALRLVPPDRTTTPRPIRSTRRPASPRRVRIATRRSTSRRRRGRTRRTSSSSPARTSASIVKASATRTMSSRGRGRPASPATWRSTTPPRRRRTATAGYSTDCASCHTTSTWLGAVFNHVLTWPDYTGCAPGGRLYGLPRGQRLQGQVDALCLLSTTDYNNTTDPKHTSAGFATTCKDCHTTTNFTTSSWVHPTNLFAFTGAHVGLDCKACHADNVFKGKGTTCVTCHLTDYNATTNPSHTLGRLQHGLRHLPQHHELGERHLQPHVVPEQPPRQHLRAVSPGQLHDLQLPRLPREPSQQELHGRAVL